MMPSVWSWVVAALAVPGLVGLALWLRALIRQARKDEPPRRDGE